MNFSPGQKEKLQTLIISFLRQEDYKIPENYELTINIKNDLIVSVKITEKASTREFVKFLQTNARESFVSYCKSKKQSHSRVENAVFSGRRYSPSEYNKSLNLLQFTEWEGGLGRGRERWINIPGLGKKGLMIIDQWLSFLNLSRDMRYVSGLKKAVCPDWVIDEDEGVDEEFS